MSEREDMTPEEEQVHRERLCEYVISTEMSLPKLGPEERSWLNEHVGEMRAFHPEHEAREGWIDYFEGDWAVTGQGRDYIWFGSEKKMVLFMLGFGGRVSKTDAHRRRMMGLK